MPSSTTAPRRKEGRRARLSLSLAVLLLAAPALAQAPPGAPAAPDPRATEVASAEELLAQAVAEVEADRLGRALPLLDDVAARLEALRREAPLDERARAVLVQAHELRGRAYFTTGQEPKATEAFRALVQVKPGHVLSRERVSPKIVAFYDGVKKGMVGSLAVSSQPAGARVLLDGELLGVTDFFPQEVLAGEHQVEVRKDGHNPEARTVFVAARATETLQLELVRNAASAFLITDPAGVEVWVDGKLLATTDGSLDPALQPRAIEGGLDPGRASARLEIPAIVPGTHEFELRKRCHEPLRLTVELPEPQDYEIAPQRLAESLASLQLQSDPPGGRILLDGQPMGVTPKTLEGVCSGRHLLEVKHAAGKFVQEVVLARDEALTLDCPIRPSLAYLGVVTEGTVPERALAEAESRLLEPLARIRSLNFFPAPADKVARVLEAERLELRSLVGAAEADQVRRATEKLAATLEVQGFLIGVLPDEKLQRRATLHLLAAGNTVADRWEVVLAEAVSFERFLAAVDRRTEPERPWAGLVTVDTQLHDGVPILRVVPHGPAAEAGLQPGEVVYAADGQPVARTADLRAAVASRRPGDRLPLSVRSAPTHYHQPGGTGRVVELTLGRTPQEIPLNDPALLYNKVMMDLRQQVEGYPGTETAAFARLNLGLCALHFADFAGAHEHLLKARTELPARPGLSQGTAAYYLGLALERLNYRQEAAGAYRAAAAFAEATLFDNDGPSVAALAARRSAP